MKNYLFLILISFVLVSCSKSSESRKAVTEKVKVLEVGSHEFIIEADIYRDLSLVSTNDSLRTFLRLIDRNAQNVPGYFSLSNQTLIKGDTRWFTEFDSTNTDHATYIEGYTSGGPLWEPGDEVDVLLTFQDLETSIYYELNATGVKVFALK